MSNNILLVLEGQKEEAVVESLTKFFLNENTVVTSVYCTTIYKLYKEVSADEDLDVFILLREIETNKERLKNFKRTDFAEIYMFFDYDGHATNASDEKLKELLEFFDEETEKGKLYISYPMLEALKHIEDFDKFKDLKFVCDKSLERYKKKVNQVCLRPLVDFRVYTFDIWQSLIEVHLKKTNLIVYNAYEYPPKPIAQNLIFKAQISKFLSIDQTVAVLSAFPPFLLDYYGQEKLRQLLVAD